MVTHYSQKELCVIGVMAEGYKKVNEATLRSRVNGLNSFTYFEVSLKNKKKLKRVANSLSQLVIQSQLWMCGDGMIHSNTDELNVANCEIYVRLLLFSHP